MHDFGLTIVNVTVTVETPDRTVNLGEAKHSVAAGKNFAIFNCGIMHDGNYVWNIATPIEINSRFDK